MDSRNHRSHSESPAADRAFAQAARWLGYRDYHSAELRLRLAEREFGDEAIQQALERLQRTGLLDDQRYLEELVRSQVRRLHGPAWIRRRLWQQGVDPPPTLDDLCRSTIDEERPALMQRLTQRYARQLQRAERQRLVSILARRGFDIATACDLVDEGLESHA